MFNEKIAGMTNKMRCYFLELKEKFEEENWQRIVKNWVTSFNGTIERNAFNRNHDQAEVKLAKDDSTSNLICLPTSSRPKTTPLHESTLRVSGLKYRNRSGIAAVFDKINTETETSND
ncbi:hypothetical protein VIBNIFTn2_120201 [Vibrio nigripulchritudo FTn2]|nr:hypothetical protein VIBNIFTn2_120201 [Vibrio nigripulchritudo FTn2]